MKQIKFLLVLLFLIIFKQSFIFAQYQEGDTLKFWSPSYIDWPPLQNEPQKEFSAICKKVGEHCYVFAEINITPSQTTVDKIVHSFDSNFFDSLQAVYGPVPDALDHDPKIFILVLNETSWGGYYDPGQQLSDSLVYAQWKKHSSQREIIYIANGSLSRGEGTVAHEFGHLLHWQQDHSPEPINNPIKYWEDAWVDEGFSTFAAFYLTETFNKHHLVTSTSFFSKNPDIPLIYFSNYNQVKLFMIYMFEHFGGWKYISALISSQPNGIEGVGTALKKLGYKESFDDVFEQWIIANYANDTIYAGGKYAYDHFIFTSCKISEKHKSYPTGLVNANVNPYGADYISFDASEPLIIDFKGQVGSKFRVDYILKDSSKNKIVDIIPATIDNLNHATYKSDKLGLDYNEIIMVVMNIDANIKENNTASYTYSAISNINKKKENKK